MSLLKPAFAVLYRVIATDYKNFSKDVILTVLWLINTVLELLRQRIKYRSIRLSS